MRPLRLLILLACFIALPILLTFTSLVFAHPRDGSGSISATDSTTGRIRALFSFHTPSSLFPPSAMISLTDDNTTFFIAKPADFTPPLPARGLDGQLWIGSGFGEDIKRDDGVVVSAEGELGCSDVPGWYEDTKKQRPASTLTSSTQRKGVEQDEVKAEIVKGGDDDRKTGPLHSESDLKDNAPTIPSVDDGTDDHLHHPLPESAAPSPADNHEQEKTSSGGHADIQSMQESAEIAGKIVLLSRGGCGFLEKVKWAQRRGAKALIVGDNARHAQLFTMYARGDTSNITIPAIFTSHTTAHLLASLMPPELLDEASDPPSTSTSSRTTSKKTFLSSKSSKKADALSSKDSGRGADGKESTLALQRQSARKGWVRSLLNVVGIGKGSRTQTSAEDSRRPPSSGNLDWVLVKDFDEEEDSMTRISRPRIDTSTKTEKQTAKPTKDSARTQKQATADDFVIGEQDWRDPDLLKPTEKSSKSDSEKQSHGESTKDAKTTQQDDTHNNGLKGGSITPGSGEYDQPQNPTTDRRKQRLGDKFDESEKSVSTAGTGGWINWLIPAKDQTVDHGRASRPMDEKPKSTAGSESSKLKSKWSQQDEFGSDREEREGLWVTLTPTRMSTSPFLDTLLVLVVSPLVTLTVVYALLLLRSRIRRRRWRAPKSVVDRLPVRTYHTMGTSAVSSQLASPDTSSPTTPLLRSITASRPRPRSRTASSLPAESNTTDSPLSSESSPEKHRPSTSYRRRYNGRQVECVVCLEEYVDGESRVMSLPCGHEFHVECITPWLTTRRRTCPICKGDVVRSMAQPGHSDVSRYEVPEDADDVQDPVAETRNDSPSAAIPIPRGNESDSDLERGSGEGSFSPNHSTTRRGWRNLASLSLSALSGETVWRQTPVDRNR